jgi:hypothetical protein
MVAFSGEQIEAAFERFFWFIIGAEVCGTLPVCVRDGQMERKSFELLGVWDFLG